MNDRIQPPPTSTAVAIAETNKTRRVLLIAWFTFLALIVASVLVTRAHAQVPTKAPAGKAPAGKAPAPKGAAAKGAAPAAKAVQRPAAPAGAKKYDVIPLNPQFQDQAIKQKMERAVKSFVSARDLNTFAELPYAKGYVDKYLPAKITQPDALAEISPLINDVMQNYARCQKAGNPGARQFLVWLYLGMEPITRGNYQPAARINATLVLGKLDSAPATGDSPPTPLRQSFPVLFRLYHDVANPDGVRAAALQGLHRYVSYGGELQQTHKDALIVEMKKLLDEPTPSNRAAKAHAYLQRYAVDILDMLAGPSDKTLATQLIGISSNPNSPDLIALHSASKFGSMSQLQGTVPAAATVLESWSKLALNAFEAELARLKGLDHPQPATDQPPDPETMVVTKPVAAAGRGMGYDNMDMDMEMGRGSGMDGSYEDMNMGSMDNYDMDSGTGMMGYGMGMGMGMMPEANPQPPEVIASRRKLNTVLEQLQRGVSGSSAPGTPTTAGGLMTAVPDADKDAVTGWIASLSDIVTNLNDVNLDDRTKYIEGLEAQITVLKGLAGVEVDQAEIDAGPVMAPIIDFGLGQPAEPAVPANPQPPVPGN